MDHDEQDPSTSRSRNNGGRAALLPIDVIIYVSQLMVYSAYVFTMLHQGGGDCEKSSPYLGLWFYSWEVIVALSRRVD
jgi:hypothetical protein